MLLAWFFYQLSFHPDIEQRIIEEMDEQLSEEGITYESVSKLTYLQCVIQESLRLYPSVPSNGFTALKDDILPGGYFVPKDAYVIYSAYILHRRADIYPNPDRFDPDRWTRQKMKPFEFMAFHGGPRECLGMNMAYLEAKVLICNILRRFRLRMHNTATIELKRAIILTSKTGIRMSLHYPTQQEKDEAHQRFVEWKTKQKEQNDNQENMKPQIHTARSGSR